MFPSMLAALMQFHKAMLQASHQFGSQLPTFCHQADLLSQSGLLLRRQHLRRHCLMPSIRHATLQHVHCSMAVQSSSRMRRL